MSTVDHYQVVLRTGSFFKRIGCLSFSTGRVKLFGFYSNRRCRRFKTAGVGNRSDLSVTGPACRREMLPRGRRTRQFGRGGQITINSTTGERGERNRSVRDTHVADPRIRGGRNDLRVIMSLLRARHVGNCRQKITIFPCTRRTAYTKSWNVQLRTERLRR